MMLLTKLIRSEIDTQSLELGKCTRVSSSLAVEVTAVEDNVVIDFCSFTSCNHLQFVHFCVEEIEVNSHHKIIKNSNCIR